MKIAAPGLPGAFAVHLLKVGKLRFALAKGPQPVGKIDQFGRDDMNDKAFALDTPAHLKELGRHDAPLFPLQLL